MISNRLGGRGRGNVLPIKTGGQLCPEKDHLYVRKIQDAQTLITQTTAEQVGEQGSFATGGFLRSQTRDRDRVQPWHDVRRKYLICSHTTERVPKVSDSL